MTTYVANKVNHFLKCNLSQILARYSSHISSSSSSSSFDDTFCYRNKTSTQTRDLMTQPNISILDWNHSTQNHTLLHSFKNTLKPILHYSFSTTFTSSSSSLSNPPSTDRRAQAKLQALSQAKEQYSQHPTPTQIQIQELLKAYSQAIKYVARSHTHDNSASTSQELLLEMFNYDNNFNSEKDSNRNKVSDRFRNENVDWTDYNYNNSNEGGEKGDGLKQETQKVLLEQLVSKIQNQHIHTYSTPQSYLKSNTSLELYPSRKDFHNVLHAWASSKARRKGIHAEYLLYKMMELSVEEEGGRLDIMPTSRSFALVMKSYSGSTYNNKLEKVQQLYELHEKLAQLKLPGFHINDPFVHIQCIKVIKDFSNPEQQKLLNLWFSRLHAFAMDKTNDHKVEVSSESNDDDNDESEIVIDLTGAYNTIIRGYAELRRAKGASDNAMQAFRNMTQAASHGNESKVFIEIKQNACNLVLRSLRDSASHTNNKVQDSLNLLQNMINAWNQSKHNTNDQKNCYPFPNDQSFALCISSLASIKDNNEARVEGERLLKLYEEMYQSNSNPLQASALPYNAYLELYMKKYGSELTVKTFDSDDDIIQRMQDKSFYFPSVQPDVNTWSLVLKSYADPLVYKDAIGEGSELKRERLLHSVDEIYEKLKKGEKGCHLNDECIFYVMKAVANLHNNNSERKLRMHQLFSDACKLGLVSANVLNTFKSNTSEEEFIKKVGSGRLADHWVANVTSGKALYTDGSKGGAGKNARRKGKSTSNWLQKQREKDEHIRSLKEARNERRATRKNKNRL